MMLNPLRTQFAALIAFSLILPLTALAEKYSERPKIEAVEAHSHDLGKTWEQLKRAHVEAVAEILEMYPDQEIYFLARDAELLYDLAVLETQRTPDAARIHLLNVSRANLNDPHLKDYLAQEGISRETLQKGKKVLFVDTGFIGTIPSKIENLFPSQAGQLQTHLICSSNSKHPSTRTFLAELNPAATESHPSQMHGSIIDYEYLPRFTYRSTRFEKSGDRWEPVSDESKSKNSSDGVVSRVSGLKYMEDLKAFGLKEEIRTLLKTRRAQWAKLRKSLDQPDQLKNFLLSLVPTFKPMVMDFLETVERHYPEKQNLLPPAEDLGISLPTSAQYGNKKALIQKHKEWAHILKDPDIEIPELIYKNNFQTLRAILDVIEDHEIVRISFAEMGKAFFKVSAERREEIEKTLVACVKNRKHLSYFEYFFGHSSYPPQLTSDHYLLNLYEALASGLDDPDEGVRLGIIRAIRDLQPQDPKLLTALVFALKDKNPRVKNAARDALNILKPQSPIVHKAIISLFDDADFSLLTKALGLLREIKPKEPQIHEAIFPLLKYPDERIQIQAADVLGECNPQDSKIHDALALLLQSPRWTIRSTALHAFGQIHPLGLKYQEAAALLLKDVDERIRVSTAILLKKMRSKSAKVHEAMALGLKDKARGVRDYLATGLQQIQPKSRAVREILIELEKDSDPAVRRRAKEVLDSLVLHEESDCVHKPEIKNPMEPVKPVMRELDG